MKGTMSGNHLKLIEETEKDNVETAPSFVLFSTGTHAVSEMISGHLGYIWYSCVKLSRWGDNET